MKAKAFVLLTSVLWLAGCDQNQTNSRQLDQSPGTANTPPAAAQHAAPVRIRDDAQIRRGAQLYSRNCAQCHGAMAQGAFNWRQRGADGKMPPPPLNGTGHAWHHPKNMLRFVIKNGSPGGQGNMPAWRDKLTDEQIDDIIAWFQSLWPEPVYEAWSAIDQRSGR